MTDALVSSDRQRTEMAIRMARVVCITGMIYVHSWTGMGGDAVKALAHSGQAIFRDMLMEVFGRSSVPLLSTISGFLVVGSAARRAYGPFIGGKARAIMLPMVAWNALAILLVAGGGSLAGMQVPIPSDAKWFADELFGLTRPNDINVQMPFLRDLFICMLAAPLLVRLDTRIIALAILGVLAWIASGWTTVLFLRPPILLFFLIGMVVRRRNLAPTLAGLAPAIVWPVFLALVSLKLWAILDGPLAIGTVKVTELQIDIVLRFAGALVYWQTAWWLATSRAAPAFQRLEPYIFLAFCSHLIMLWLGGHAVGLVIGSLGSPLYPFFLVAQPFIVLVATLGLASLLRLLPVPVGDALSGGRLPRHRPPAEPPLAPASSRQ